MEASDLSLRRRLQIILRAYACRDTPYLQALTALEQACPMIPIIRLAAQLNRIDAARDRFGRAPTFEEGLDAFLVDAE